MKSSERRAEHERAEATLATIDAALEAGRAGEEGDRERELGQLALTLRAGAPQPSASFAADLEERVWAGFSEAENDRSSARRRARGRWHGPMTPEGVRISRPALGTLAVTLLALVAVGGVLSSGGGMTRDGIVSQAPGGGAAAPPSAPEGDRGAGPSLDALSGGARSREGPSSGPRGLPVKPLPSSPGFAPEQPERRIERTASLTLAAPEDRLDTVSDGVVAVTDRHRGFIVSSSTFSGEDEPAGGSFDLRIPADELRATLSDLAALGTVRAQSQTGDDLTEPVATAADRLDGARADRRGLLRRLERADSDREARAVRRQLDLVSGEIGGLQRELEALEERTDYARVSVTLTDESSSGAAGTPSSTESALEDAVGSVVAAFNLAVRALGVLLPLALVAGLGWLGFSAARRRRSADATAASASVRAVADPTCTSSRWLTLFVATRLVATVVAAALLVAHPRPALGLAVAAVGYGVVTTLAALRWPPARARPAVWAADAAVVLALVLVAGEWRSPFYPLALTTLVIPATSLPVRRAAAFGAAFTGGYFAVALATGIDWAMLRTTSRLESLSTHLLMPVLIVVALAYAAHLLASLERERQRAEGLAVEAERNRIARELHDSAKQRIHAAHLVLSSAERRVPPGSAAASVGQAMSELRAATADMETSLSELRTPLEGRALGEAVRARARELEAAGTPIEVDGEAPSGLPTFVAVHAFRVASEAMTNAIRHAGATRVWVRLEEDGPGLTLTVADDGAGMPQRLRPGSHGLSSMRARAERLGGDLLVGARGEGGGTVIRLAVPLDRTEMAA